MSGAVYRHFAENGELLYVGYSANPFTRSQSHCRTAPWFKEVSKITIQWFDTVAEAMAAEVEAIKTECPRENVTNMPDDLFKKRKLPPPPPPPPPYIDPTPHAQLDAVQRAFGIKPTGWCFEEAGLTVERQSEIRKSGRELFASEVVGLKRTLSTTYKILEAIGLHRGNLG